MQPASTYQLHRACAAPLRPALRSWRSFRKAIGRTRNATLVQGCFYRTASRPRLRRFRKSRLALDDPRPSLPRHLA